jgi:hypothetical protein
MGANMLYDLVHFILHPIPLFAVAFVIRGVFCILVSIGIGWARVFYVIIAALTTFIESSGLFYYFVVKAKYGQFGSHPDTDQVTISIVLPVIHIVLSIWTLWVLAFSENVSEFFSRKKYRISN